MPAGSFVLLSVVTVGLFCMCALIVLADVLRGHRQKMAVMDFVWPMTALYVGPIGVWAYWTMGRAPNDGEMKMGKPFWQRVFVSTCHCGAGCTLGDIFGEAIAFALTLSLFGSTMWGSFALDFVIAYTAGLALQYVVIRPMKGLSPKEGLIVAFKADTISIVAFQIGMYLWMAFSMRLTDRLEANDIRYWAMMIVAILVGFGFSYPANWWLVKKGIKEAM